MVRRVAEGNLRDSTAHKVCINVRFPVDVYYKLVELQKKARKTKPSTSFSSTVVKVLEQALK